MLPLHSPRSTRQTRSFPEKCFANRRGGRRFAWASVLLITALCGLAPTNPTAAQPAALAEATWTPLSARPDAELAAILEPLIATYPGEVGVAIKHLGTGQAFQHRADEPMSTASLIKLPVMVTAYEKISAGAATREQAIELKEADKVPGSGILTTNFSPGLRLSLRDAIRLMIAYSDNTATNLVIDAIGLDQTSAAMERLGYAHTRLHSKVYRRDTSIAPERSQRFGLGSTSAGETLDLLERLAGGQIIDQVVSEEILDHLYACEDRDKLARLLPAGVRIAHKSGYVSTARCDAGLIDGPDGRIAIVVLTENFAAGRPTAPNDASLLIANIAAATHRHFYPQAWRVDLASDPTELRNGSVGPRVEALQRALNRVLQPSPDLAVDGDFGPATESALMRYQRSVDLPATGTFDSATATKLGPLQPDSVASVNAATNDSQPVEELAESAKEQEETGDGPPAVSCRAWAVGNANTGEVLFGSDIDLPLDNASTTKLMTAWLVAEVIRQHPAAIDEVLTFSERADQTIGSTAGIEAGEQVRVGDLLYGLMLPSGNDASVALAEHFGARLNLPEAEPVLESREPSGGDAESEPETTAAEDSYERFVRGMNLAAERLGLTNSRFRNPHGLTAPGHQVSAGDLVKLAHLVLNDPLLAPIVGTRRHRGEILRPDGSRRQAVWSNTNRLLRIEGYDGLKTGTTNAAGACLVASGRRVGADGDEHRLIVVVLGASGSDARYADARNLFRWSWRQLDAAATGGE